VSVHAGDPAAANAELTALDASVDGLGSADPDGQRIGILLAEALIGAHSGMFDVADAAVDRLASIWRARATRLNSEVFRRAREADIAFYEGLIAAYKGEYDVAAQKAQDYIKEKEFVQNPRKHEPAYLLQGLIALRQSRYVEAVDHFERTLDTYIRDGGNFSLETYLFYNHGLALEGAGRTAEALQRFQQVAAINFSTVGAALVRQDALAKAGM
jgi:tetratricopeptide (TPR) repeat protein